MKVEFGSENNSRHFFFSFDFMTPFSLFFSLFSLSCYKLILHHADPSIPSSAISTTGEAADCSGTGAPKESSRTTAASAAAAAAAAGAAAAEAADAAAAASTLFSLLPNPPSASLTSAGGLGDLVGMIGIPLGFDDDSG